MVKSKTLWVALIASLLANMVLLLSVKQNTNTGITVLKDDDPLVTRVFEYYARENNSSVQRAKEGRLPVVITFDHQRCVSLSLKRGLIGFEPVYCINRKTGDLVYKRLKPT